MDLILDTHALIWFINGDHQLPNLSKPENKKVRKVQKAKFKKQNSKSKIQKAKVKKTVYYENYFNELCDYLFG